MRIWRKRDEFAELGRELLTSGPEPRPKFARALEQRVRENQYRRPVRGVRLGVAGALTAAMLVTLASLGGLGYAASTVSRAAHVATHLVTPQSHTGTAGANAAAAQYGKKVAVCTVQPNGKQHTIVISKNAVASYLATHPKAYLGVCNAGRHGAKPNVCVKMSKRRFAPVWVPPKKVKGYLKRNHGSHRSKNGKC
jgi:hypothetical protein